MKILLIEDDQFTREMYQLQFEKMGHTVICAEDGVSGLELAKDPTLDCVLLDIMLPQMDGVKVLQAIRENEKKENRRMVATVIMLTNLGQEDIYQKCLAIGANGYIIKARSLPKEVLTQVEIIVNSQNKLKS